MSDRWPGGVVSGTVNTPVTTPPYCSGVWTMEQAAYWIAQGQWPYGPSDSNFENVTLLLNGDGTNGGQNNTFLDSSTNNFTITRNGNTTQGSFSPYGDLWSNIFTTTTSRVTYGSESNWAFLSNGASDWTIDGWIFYSAANGDIVNTSGGSAQVGMQLYFGNPSSGLLTVYFTNGGGATGGSSTSAMTANQWNYFAVTFTSSTKVIAYYINGVAAGTNSHSGFSFSGSNPNFAARIGNSLFGSQGGGTNTMLSNLRISNTVRTGLTTVPTSPRSSDGNTSLLVCNSNSFADKSSNNYSFSINSVPVVQRFSPFEPSAPYFTSIISGSGYFDGSGDQIFVADAAPLQLQNTSFTIEGWFYATDYAGSGGVVCLGSNYGGSTSGWNIQIDNTGNAFYASFRGDPTDISASVTVLKNTWNHFAVSGTSSSSTSSLKLYLNGVQVGSTYTGATNLNSGARTTIGSLYTGSSYVQNYTGYISNFRILKGTALYTGSTYTVPTAPLTAITNTSLLCDFTNAAIPDYAMMNDLETAGNAQVSTSVKKYGTGSLSFDGNGDYLRTPANNFALPLAGNFTIEFWVYFNSTSTTQTIIGQWESPTFWEFYYLANTQLRFYYDNTNFINLGALSTSTWYHVAAVRSGSTITAYLNGTSQGTATSSATIGSATKALGIGSESPWTGFYFNGYLDDIRITNGVARYTANFTPPTTALPTF